jgi:DNA polymerase
MHDCRACPLWKDATQVVPGEGPANADVMLVGEEPGDQEDRQGKVFVGPAGRVLDQALEAAGMDRHSIFLTNAVKHFKWEYRGSKRRIHQRPSTSETLACRRWLEGELELVHPRLVIGLGATAARTLAGTTVRVTKDRGKPVDSDVAEHVVVTVHPSSILRGGDNERQARFDDFVADLRAAKELL